MLEQDMTFKIEKVHIKEKILYLQLSSTDDNDTLIIDKKAAPEELEYIFLLISNYFSYVEIGESILPCYNNELYKLDFCVKFLPFTDHNKSCEIKQWNDLVTSVSNDFIQRRKCNMWKIKHDKLYNLIEDCWRDFPIEDRERLDVDQLINLVIFSYDFCYMTLYNAHLHPSLYDYIQVPIIILGKKFYTSRRTADKFKKYLTSYSEKQNKECKDYSLLEATENLVEYNLPEINYIQPSKNPYASDSYFAAMFIDLLHKFFNTIGIKKRKGAEWSQAERYLIYELLRFFDICKSKKSAKDSKYVTTITNEFSDYFKKCNLDTWLRSGQEYSYLFCKQSSDFF